MDKLYEDLKEMLEANLKQIAKKGDLSADDLCKVKEATSALAHIQTLRGGMGYSEGTYRVSYGPDRSPVTGRYISGGYQMGYSGHSIKDRMVAKLETLYDEAKTEHERQLISNTINRIHTEN